MSFPTNDGFYQYNYDDQNQQNQSNQAYNQQPMTDGYDYNNQGYYNPQQSYGGYGDQTTNAPSSSYAGHYSGQIMQPQQNLDQQNMQNDNYSGGFEDEPPLLEELGINFDHIYRKTIAVLNPFKDTDPSIINETDLAGPLCFCLALGATLLLGGKVSFGYIYGIGGLGVAAIYGLLNIMSMTGVTIGCVASIIGYCILPMVFLSIFSVILSLKGIVGILLTLLTVFWCSISASKLFVCGFAMESQQLLIAYPCALLYGVFALLTVF